MQLQLDKPITAGRLNTHAASSDPRSATMSRRRSCLQPPHRHTTGPHHRITGSPNQLCHPCHAVDAVVMPSVQWALRAATPRQTQGGRLIHADTEASLHAAAQEIVHKIVADGLESKPGRQNGFGDRRERGHHRPRRHRRHQMVRRPPESPTIGEPQDRPEHLCPYGAVDGFRNNSASNIAVTISVSCRFAAPSLNVRTMKHDRVWVIEMPCQGLPQLD